MRDAINLAIRTSPVAAGAVAQLRIAHFDEQVATGEYLPTLNLTFGFLHEGAPSFAGISTAGDVSRPHHHPNRTIETMPRTITIAPASRSALSRSPNNCQPANAAITILTSRVAPTYAMGARRNAVSTAT